MESCLDELGVADAGKCRHLRQLTKYCNVMTLDWRVPIHELQRMVTNERRRHPRFPFHSKGILIGPDKDYRGALIDISVFGALFEAECVGNVVPGTRCRLEVLNVDDSSLLKVEGVVSHAVANRVGIEFEKMDEARKERIRSIAHLNLAPTSVLERPLPTLL